MQNQYLKLLDDPSYDPFSILDRDVSVKEESPWLDNKTKKVLEKYLFGGNSLVFLVDSVTNVHLGFWKWVHHHQNRTIMKELLKATFYHRKNIKRHLVDCIFLMSYRPYILTQHEINLRENTFNSYQLKRAGKGILSFLNGKGFIDGTINYEEKIDNEKTKQLKKVMIQSILVFLLHLNELQVLDYSIEYYMIWLEKNGFEWINPMKSDDYLRSDFLMDSILPEELPSISGKRLYYIFTHVNEYENYYKTEYDESHYIQQTINSIKNNKRLIDDLNEIIAWKYED